MRLSRRSAVLPVLWLLALLAACDGKSPTPPTEEPEKERLLTDAELATPADPAAPAENALWSDWIAANHHPIRSLTSSKTTDLQFLKPLLAGRRIVQLGESGHGVAEFNLAKVRLIRFLHEEMGFDVIAFESGLYECWAANRDGPSLTALATMRRCTFQVWQTNEVLPLFEYIESTRGTARPLTIAGFDAQSSGHYGGGTLGRAAFLRDVVARLDATYAQRVWKLDSTTLAHHWQATDDVEAAAAWYTANAQALMPAYDSLSAWMESNAAALAQAYGAASDVPRTARGTARYLSAQLRLYLVERTEGIPIRDKWMADNLDYLLDVMYPGKKVVVWAHNFHVAHAVAPEDFAMTPMGGWVSQRRRAELYTVGLYMYTGQAANNAREVYDVDDRHRSGSLESLLYRARRKYLFLDFSQAPAAPGTSWMTQPRIGKEWGVVPKTIVPRTFYDGVLFVHTTNAPDYIPPPE
ncbi:MAG TPA: erythromycin esterase family protein [Longimicrobium sp.]|nr:erythromycin esterase family protein [Longimicrobium sp.]